MTGKAVSKEISFKDLQESLSTHFCFDKESDYLLDLSLAVPLSVELDNPVWMMIQAASSDGKSTILQLPELLDNYKKLHQITGKALFSAHKEADGGVIPVQIGNKGIICFPDFTTVLSKTSRERSEIFSSLRIAYDGEASKFGGINSKDDNLWKGKIACIAGVTGAIEKVKKKASDLGERFLYFRHNPSSLEDMSMLFRKGSGEAVQRTQEVYKKLYNQLKAKVEVKEPRDIKNITKLSNLIANCRQVVERHSSTREIVQLHDREKPYRLIKQLGNLSVCLDAIHTSNSIRVDDILKKIAISSIPESRFKCIKLLKAHKHLRFEEITKDFKISDTAVRRCLEDLEAISIVDKNGVNGSIQKWRAREDFVENYRELLK